MALITQEYTINVTSSNNKSVVITRSIDKTILNESIDRIDKLLTAAFVGYSNGKTVTIRQLLQLSALFDTLHDFGKYSTCYDTLSGGRSETVMENYKILRMRFSALSKLVFGIDSAIDRGIASDRLSRGYGSLRTPAQVYTSALTAKTLEADFLEFARKYREAAKTGTFISSNKGSDYGPIMSKLRNNKYGHNDPTYDKVCLLVDTQKMLYKWSGFTNNCIVAILRESVYDAAGKLLISDTTGKNVHVETFRSVNGGTSFSTNPYTYKTGDDSNDFVGNIEVELGPIAANDNYKSYNIRARIGNNTILVQGNSGAKHPNSILMLNKNIDGAANATCATMVGDTLITQNTDNVNKPYNGYVNSDKNTADDDDGCTSFANNNANFTQKRTGDGNQACICKRINTRKVQIRARNNIINSVPITIKKIVLVTIDRMLYAIALLLNIPVIYEHPTEGAAYIPNDNDDVNTNSIMGGGGNSGMNDDSNTSMNDDSNTSMNDNMNDNQPNQLNIPKTPTIYQRGGANLTLARNAVMNDDEAIYILENPVYMLALAPFIHAGAYNNSTSNFKTAIESILAVEYITFMNQSPVGIDRPADTTYLRNVISTTTTMTNLIGQANTPDNVNNNTDIKIIYLSSENDEYTLIYKYATENNNNNTRNLYIMKGSSTTVALATADTFGPNRIKGLFSEGISIDSESSESSEYSEKIEEMLGELLAIDTDTDTDTDTEKNGFSFMGTIYSWAKPVFLGLVGAFVYQKFFNSGNGVPQVGVGSPGDVGSLGLGSPDDDGLLGGGSKIGGKLSPLSDSSINSSVEPDAAKPAEDDSSIKSSVDSSIKSSVDSSINSSKKDDDDSKQSEEKYPLLTKNDNYYAVAFNYTQTHKIIRDHGVNLPFYDDLCNVFTMFSYLWLFNKYVINVCIDDEETAIAYDQWSVKGKAQSVTSEAESVADEEESVTSDSRTVLIPTHKSLYILFDKMADIIKKEGTLPFLLTDLEQVLFDEKDYMYFQLQQIKRYVLRDDFIEVVEEKVDEQTVSEAKVDEATVDEATLDKPTISEAKVDEATVDEPTVSEAKVDEPPVGKPSLDKPPVSEAKVGEAKVGKPSVDKEIILKFIKEANDEEQIVNTELSRLSETDNFDDLLKYAIDRNLTRYGMFYMYSDYLTYISTLSIKKSTPSDSIESSNVDNSIKSTTLDNSNDNSIDNSIKSSTLDNSNDNSIDNSNESTTLDNSNESTTLDNSNESSPVDYSNDNSIKSTSIYSNSNKSSSLDSNSKSSSLDKNSKSSSLDNSIDNNSTSSSVSSAILSRGGIHKKKSSKINRKTKVHRVTKNKRKVSESRKSKKKKHSKRKLLAKKKRGTRKNNRKNRK